MQLTISVIFFLENLVKIFLHNMAVCSTCPFWFNWSSFKYKHNQWRLNRYRVTDNILTIISNAFIYNINTGKAVLVILCGLIVRVTVAVLAVTGNKFTIKEKIFIGFSWLPKATVQVRRIFYC